MKIKNVAIIAHVDHGKTTLVDQLLKQSNTLGDREKLESRAMDSNDIEKERGITILAKTTAINYKDYRINIMDTPGHADFGGEVERIMNMVDGVILLVDSREGPMPQTRFVLKKAMDANVKPIVVINKIDREHARPLEVIDEVLELFIELGANDEQLDFKVVYASGLAGTSSLDPDPSTQENTMDYILDTILEEIPDPKGNPDAHLQFQPSLLDYSEYFGRIGIGRIEQGKIHVNDFLSCIRRDGKIDKFRVQKLYGFLGLQRIEIEEASAGDIVAVAGLVDIGVGETVCEVGYEEALPLIKIDEPTLQMTFAANSSPFAGLDGKNVTASKIDARLFKEMQRDVSLRVAREAGAESWVVNARGELHLSILIENMRREGFEFQVSRPRVIIKEIDGVKCEPYEYVQVDVPEDTVGPVMELIGARHGQLESMDQHQSLTRLIYTMPSRGLIGFNTMFMTATKGYGMLSHYFTEFKPMDEVSIGERSLGALVASETGKSTAYGMGQIEDRGTLFVEPGEEVYEGQIVGVANKEEDLAVNVAKGKNLSNMRSSSKDSTVVLKKSKVMTLEMCLDFINEDELVEVTPSHIRLRKQILNTELRKKADARKARGE